MDGNLIENVDRCLDKIGGMGLPDHDVDGDPRPLHGKWDYGADEVHD